MALIKRALMLATLALVQMNENAFADVVTLAYTATIYNIVTNAGSEPIYLGELISGTISYDTSAALPGPSQFIDNRSYVFPSSASMTANFGGLSFDQPLTFIQLLNRASLDRFVVDTSYDLTTGTFRTLSSVPIMGLWVDGVRNSSSGLLTSTDLPLKGPNMAFVDPNTTSPFLFHSTNLNFDALVTSISFVPKPVTFVFDLPSTAETSQTPPYPLVATLTLTEDSTGVNFVLTPNWSSPGSDDKSHIMSVDYVYKGPADPVTTYLSGAAIAHFDYHTNQNGMDGSYKTNDQYLEVDFSNNDEQFDSTHSNSSWSVAGAHLTDFTESFAESKSKPPFIFGLIVVAGYHLPGINPTPSTWVAAVPEPETYAMFLAGLGLMGFIARRRKNSQA